MSRSRNRVKPSIIRQRRSERTCGKCARRTPARLSSGQCVKDKFSPTIPAAFPLKPRSPPPGLLSPEAVSNLILTPEETADVAAYTILSLRDQHFRYEPQLASEQFHARLQGHN